jgi:hypothetical protein
MWLGLIRHKLFGSPSQTAIAANTLEQGPNSLQRLLIFSSTKHNQNFYRDVELAQQTRAVFLTENFNYGAFDWDVEQIATHLIGGVPDWIFLNYVQSYSHRLKGFDRLGAPVLGFVGDHYNFLEDSPPAQVKQSFFRSLPLAGLVTAYPHTNQIVADALAQPTLPFIYLPWAIDPTIFHDLGKTRRNDIACMGALTEGKYPFRREVRAWLENQKSLKLFGKTRVKGLGGSDHDGVAFNLALNNVRSAFTCSSVMRYTLMKYFEIPGSGALLFGETTPEFYDLGFRDQEHYVSVTPDNFKERFSYYLSREGHQEAERIRRTGYAFVHSNHTWKQRITGFLNETGALLKLRQK